MSLARRSTLFLLMLPTSAFAQDPSGFWTADDTPLEEGGLGGSWVGAPAYEEGLLNSGFSLRTGNAVAVPDDPDLRATTALTISAWVSGPFATYVSEFDPGSYSHIVNKEGEYDFSIRNRYLCYIFANPGLNTGYYGGHYICGGNPIPHTAWWHQDSQDWHHVALVYDNGTTRTYIDGLFNAVGGGPSTLGDADTTRDDLYIGSRQNPAAASNFNGGVDQVRVFQRALSPTEIATLAAEINLVDTDGNEHCDTNDDIDTDEDGVADDCDNCPDVPTIASATNTRGCEDGLVGYWPAEGEGRDLSGNGYDAVDIGSPAITSGAIGDAFDFSAGHLLVGDDPSLRLDLEMSVVAWVRPSGSAVPSYILNKEGEYEVWIQGTAVCRAYGSSFHYASWTWWTDPFCAGTSMTVGGWHQVVVTQSDSSSPYEPFNTVRVYVDGVLQSVVGGGLPEIGEAERDYDELRIGNRQHPLYQSAYSGLVDEIQLYNRPLSYPEIQALFLETGPLFDCTETGDADGDLICDDRDRDDDNDDVPDDLDPCPTIPGVSCEEDTDGDGVPDDVDGCPNEDATGFDLNFDGCLDDTDGDGVTDDLDECPLEDATGFDLNLDGCLDDTDGDGVTDDVDLCPIEDATGFDLDADGCLDDTDGDGVTDNLDRCPDWDDADDDDLDGQPDGCDPCPDDPLNDQDGDLICHAMDPCPLDTDDGLGGDDLDGDGVCNSDDQCIGDDQLDTDEDGIPDDCDLCPLDPYNDADLDGVCGDVDPCVGNNNLDADLDGVPDDCDLLCPLDPLNDADFDGVCAGEDPCPLDYLDDSDNDSRCDSDDRCPGADDRLDGDSDTLPDCLDRCPDDDANDADGDGFCEDVDNCDAVDNGDQGDQDQDGLGDVCDPDRDGDGWSDDVDNCDAVANVSQTDTDGDGAGNACDADDDGDGVNDGQDRCPATPSGSDVVSTGCDVNQACPPTALWKNHGDYVSCVAHVANDLRRSGTITAEESSAMVQAAAQSSIGRTQKDRDRGHGGHGHDSRGRCDG